MYINKEIWKTFTVFERLTGLYVEQWQMSTKSGYDFFYSNVQLKQINQRIFKPLVIDNQ